MEGLKAADEIAWMVFHGKIPKIEFSEGDQMSHAARLLPKDVLILPRIFILVCSRLNPGIKRLCSSWLSAATKTDESKGHRHPQGTARRRPAGKATNRGASFAEPYYWRLDKEKDFEFCCNKILSSGSAAAKKKALFNLGAYNFERNKFPRPKIT